MPQYKWFDTQGRNDVMAAPTPITPQPPITTWYGVMALDWLYPPPESTWDAGVYGWDDPESFWDNGLNSGNWGFNMQYDLINNGSWVTCLLTDGTNASNHDMDTFAWNHFHTSWDITGQAIDDSPNCKVRVWVYNRDSTEDSDFGYYGTVAVKSIPYPILIGFAGSTSFRWQPSEPSDYPQNILSVTPNVAQLESVTGRVQVVRRAVDVDRFNIHFPLLPEADIDNFLTFIADVDYQKTPFVYRDKEVNAQSPFSSTWRSVWVKLEKSKVEKSQIRGGYYSLTIAMRATRDRVGLFSSENQMDAVA